MESNNLNRCVHCMALLEMNQSPYCPICGQPARQVNQPNYCIRPLSVLHGKYLVGKKLGQGGFGITYVGLDLVLDVKVAIKECFPQSQASRNCTVTNALQWSSGMLQGDQWKASCGGFLREARKLAKMKDIPEVVRVQDTFEENNTAYIIMEYVEGMTLKQGLEKNGLMRPEQCVTMLRPLLLALEKVHQQGFIHRDISPDNIMIQPSGQLRLLDLGAAKEMRGQSQSTTHLVTKDGFSPLEQYTETGNIGPWTDVYAICATMYYCMTGHSVPSALDRAAGVKFVIPPTVPDSIAAVLWEGLALDWRNRIQSLEVLVPRLDAAIRPPVPEKKKKWLLPSLIGAASLLALALAIWCIKDVQRESKTPDTDGEVGQNSEPSDMQATDSDSGQDQQSTPEQEPAPTPVPLTAVTLGTPNSNIHNSCGWLKIPYKYSYFVGGDNGLYVCKYDEESGNFPLYDAVMVRETASGISQGDDKVYFISTDYTEISIFSMEQDGSEITALYTVSGSGYYLSSLEYAELSDGSRVLYFFEGEQPTGQMDENPRKLCKLDLSDTTKGPETVLEGSIIWYNINKEFIYYTEVMHEERKIRLLKCSLDGGEPQVLNEDKRYTKGFIEDDTLFLWSENEGALVALSMDGEKIDGREKLYDCRIDPNYAFCCGNGWIYYVDAEEKDIRRVRVNGTGDTLVLEDHTAGVMSFSDDFLWFIEMKDSGREHQQLWRANFVYFDGSERHTDLFPSTNWGLEVESSTCFTLEEDGSGVSITGYTGTKKCFTIPDSIDGRPVVSIGENAFKDNDTLEQIGLPRGVRTLGDNAFKDCDNLTFIGLPDGLDKVGYAAFLNADKLSQLDLPNSLVSIGALAFAETKFANVTIPASVKDIGYGAFAVRPIAEFKEFVVDRSNDHYTVLDGVLFTKDMGMLVAFPSSIAGGSYSIPEGTREIDNYAFCHCKHLIELEIPSSVEVIGEYALWDTGINKLMVSSHCSLPNNLSNDDIEVETYE